MNATKTAGADEFETRVSQMLNDCADSLPEPQISVQAGLKHAERMSRSQRRVRRMILASLVTLAVGSSGAGVLVAKERHGSKRPMLVESSAPAIDEGYLMPTWLPANESLLRFAPNSPDEAVVFRSGSSAVVFSNVSGESGSAAAKTVSFAAVDDGQPLSGATAESQVLFSASDGDEHWWVEVHGPIPDDVRNATITAENVNGSTVILGLPKRFREVFRGKPVRSSWNLAIGRIMLRSSVANPDFQRVMNAVAGKPVIGASTQPVRGFSATAGSDGQYRWLTWSEGEREFNLSGSISEADLRRIADSLVPITRKEYLAISGVSVGGPGSTPIEPVWLNDSEPNPLSTTIYAPHGTTGASVVITLAFDGAIENPAILFDGGPLLWTKVLQKGDDKVVLAAFDDSVHAAAPAADKHVSVSELLPDDGRQVEWFPVEQPGGELRWLSIVAIPLNPSGPTKIDLYEETGPEGASEPDNVDPDASTPDIPEDQLQHYRYLETVTVAP